MSRMKLKTRDIAAQRGETAERVLDPLARQKLMVVIRDDVDRLNRLISDISNASRLDAELSRDERRRPIDNKR